MELLKSHLQQTVHAVDRASNFGNVHLKDFGTLEFEKYSALRRGDRAARYLFFFGHASHEMRRQCYVTLHVTCEQPPNSFHYERIEQIQSQNVPDLAEVGYKMSEERFVIKPRNGRPRMRRVEDFTKQFFEDVVAKHFG